MSYLRVFFWQTWQHKGSNAKLLHRFWDISTLLFLGCCISFITLFFCLSINLNTLTDLCQGVCRAGRAQLLFYAIVAPFFFFGFYLFVTNKILVLAFCLNTLTDLYQGVCRPGRAQPLFYDIVAPFSFLSIFFITNKILVLAFCACCLFCFFLVKIFLSVSTRLSSPGLAFWWEEHHSFSMTLWPLSFLCLFRFLCLPCQIIFLCMFFWWRWERYLPYGIYQLGDRTLPGSSSVWQWNEWKFWIASSILSLSSKFRFFFLPGQMVCGSLRINEDRSWPPKEYTINRFEGRDLEFLLPNSYASCSCYYLLLLATSTEYLSHTKRESLVRGSTVIHSLPRFTGYG